MMVNSGYQRFEIKDGELILHDGKKSQKLKFNVISPILKELVSGNTVLDIGASNGLYSFFSALNGAANVVALENGKIHVGGTNIKLLKDICKNCDIENVKPVNQCFTKYNDPADVVIALAIMHHLYFDTKAYPTFNSLIKHLSHVTNKYLIIEWVDVSVGGPYQTRTNKYTFDEFKSSILTYFSGMKEIGITNPYDDPNRPPRVTFLCTK